MDNFRHDACVNARKKSNVNGTVSLFHRLSTPVAVMLAAVVAGCLSAIAGIVAGWSAIYLYDRGSSKGVDFAVGVSALLATGTFIFVTCFSWINKLHHRIQWGTPAAALVISIGFVSLVTWSLWDADYSGFILVGWLAVLVCAGLALVVASRFMESPNF